MDISISCQNDLVFFYLFIVSFLESPFQKLSLSLFMSWVGTNYYNPSPPADQSTFFTNFPNGSPYFHNCYALNEFRIYLLVLEENRFLAIFEP